MANVLIFDEETGRGLKYLVYVAPEEFKGRTDVLINPEVPPGISVEQLVVKNGIIREFTIAEKSAIAIEKAEQFKQTQIQAIDSFEGVSLKEAIFALITLSGITKKDGSEMSIADMAEQIKLDRGLIN